MGNTGISENELLQRLVEVGLGALPGDRLAELAESLERSAVETGLAAPLFVSDAIHAIDQLASEHDEPGGIRIGFLRQLDNLIHDHLPTIRRGDPPQAAARARLLRNEIFERIARYDPRETYED